MFVGSACIIVYVLVNYSHVSMFCSLVVTFAAIRLPVTRFKPRPGQTFGSRSLLHAYPEISPREPKMADPPVPVKSPDTKRGLVVGCREHHRKSNKTTEIDCYAIDTNGFRTQGRIDR